MNVPYLMWLISRQIRQPAALLLGGVFIALVAFVSIFVIFTMHGQTIQAIQIGGRPIEEPGYFINGIVPSFIYVILLVSFILFIIAASTSSADTLYHPMNSILLVTPLTRKAIYLTSWLSTTLLFSILFAIFSLLLTLIVWMKTGYSILSPILASIGWMALLYATCSALAVALTPIFKKSTPVLIMILAMMFLSSILGSKQEWYFSALNVVIPSIANYLSAAVESLNHAHEANNLVLPGVVSAVYLGTVMWLYEHQDLR